MALLMKFKYWLRGLLSKIPHKTNTIGMRQVEELEDLVAQLRALQEYEDSKATYIILPTYEERCIIRDQRKKIKDKMQAILLEVEPQKIPNYEYYNCNRHADSRKPSPTE